MEALNNYYKCTGVQFVKAAIYHP